MALPADVHMIYSTTYIGTRIPHLLANGHFPRPRLPAYLVFHNLEDVYPSLNQNKSFDAWESHLQDNNLHSFTFHFIWCWWLPFVWVKDLGFQESSPRGSYPSYWSFIECIEFIEWNNHCYLYFLNPTLSQFQTRVVKSRHISSRHTIHIYFQGRPSHTTIP